MNLRPDINGVNGLIELCGKLPYCTRIIEIGCCCGDSTEIFINALNPDKFYCIDIWAGGYDSNDSLSRDYPSDAEKIFDERMRNYRSISKIKLSFEKAVDLFEDESIDFIYLDADHTYEATKEAMILYLPKLKKGGYFGGHDYSIHFPGVMQSVNELLGGVDLFIDTSFLWQKT